MTKEKFIDLENNITIYNNRDGLILDVISTFKDTSEHYAKVKEGYIECFNSLRKGRADYEATIYKVKLKDHSHWNIYKQGDYDKITNYKLYRNIIDYQLANNTSIINFITQQLFGGNVDHINTLF